MTGPTSSSAARSARHVLFPLSVCNVDCRMREVAPSRPCRDMLWMALQQPCGLQGFGLELELFLVEGHKGFLGNQPRGSQRGARGTQAGDLQLDLIRRLFQRVLFDQAPERLQQHLTGVVK